MPKLPWVKTTPRQAFDWSIKTAILVVACLAGVSFAIYLLFNGLFSTEGLTSEQELPQLQPTTVLTGNALQRFMESHGPWLSTAESGALRDKSGVRNLALFRTNGLTYSSQSVRFSKESPWTQYSPPSSVTGVEAEGQTIRVEIDHRNTFTLNATQPFMLEGDLNRVYVIDQDRKLWSTLVRELIFSSAQEVEDPSLPPNPGLSQSFGN